MNRENKNFSIKYDRDKSTERLKTIRESIKHPKFALIKYKGESISIEYIDIHSKIDVKKAIVILPGFEASYRSYTGTAKELALYNNNQRVICLSHLSGKSSQIKDYSLYNMSKVTMDLFIKIGLERYEITVVGHSRSDLLALNLSRTYPDKIINIVLANGILANKNKFWALAIDFSKHVLLKITPERLLFGCFKGESGIIWQSLKQSYDFMSNLGSFNLRKTINQVKSLNDRKKINFDDFFSQLKSNVLILSGTKEFTPYEDTLKQISEKLPEDINSQLRIEVDGLHDEIIVHPEAFALKLKRWLESLEI
jgi:pimeloyl-ACP methyl ester carboxylesterase